jgi:NTP pyrophosphatase (non-canonical NTP hydrolase)
MNAQQENDILKGLVALGIITNDMSREKGFWDPHPVFEKIMASGELAAVLTQDERRVIEQKFDRNDGEALMLMVSELGECLEAMCKNPDEPSEHIPDFTAVEEELADLVIRVAEFARGRNYSLAGAVLAKIKFNASRPHKHGKQF